MPRIDLPTGKHAFSGQVPKGAERVAINCPHGDMRVIALFWSGDNYPAGVDKWGNPKFDGKGDEVHEATKDHGGGPKVVDRLRPWRFDVNKGATNFSIYYDYPEPDDRYTYHGSLDFL